MVDCCYIHLLMIHQLIDHCYSLLYEKLSISYLLLGEALLIYQSRNQCSIEEVSLPQEAMA